MQVPKTQRSPVGGVLALVGGGLLAAGSFLDWAEVSGTGTSVTPRGIDGTDGWITLVAGALALVAGLTKVRGAGGRSVAILAIVAGLLGGGVGLYDALTARDSGSVVLDSAAEELARGYGGSVERMRSLLDAAIEAGELGVTVSVGLYLVITGGAVSIVGGAIALRRGSAVAPTPMASETAADVPSTSEPWATAPAPMHDAPHDLPQAPAPPQSQAMPPAPPAEPPSPPAAPGAPDGSSIAGSEPEHEPADQTPSPWAIPAPDEGEPPSDEER